MASGSSPGFGNLLIRDGRPGRLTVPLLLELSVEGLFNVIHVKGADGRAGDAADRWMDRGRGIEISKDLQMHTIFWFAQEKNKTKRQNKTKRIQLLQSPATNPMFAGKFSDNVSLVRTT